MWTEIIIGLVVVSLAGMTIPILQIIKSQPKNPEYDERLKNLEERIKSLEGESASKTLEIEDLRKELAFTTTLLNR